MPADGKWDLTRFLKGYTHRLILANNTGLKGGVRIDHRCYELGCLYSASGGGKKKVFNLPPKKSFPKYFYFLLALLQIGSQNNFLARRNSVERGGWGYIYSLWHPSPPSYAYGYWKGYVVKHNYII